MFAVEVYAAVRRFVFLEGHSRREAARVFGLRAPSTCRTEVAMAYDESSVLVVTPQRRRR